MASHLPGLIPVLHVFLQESVDLTFTNIAKNLLNIRGFFVCTDKLIIVVT